MVRGALQGGGLVVLCVVVLAGCGRSLPDEEQEVVPSGGDETGAFGDVGGGSTTVKVAAFAGARALAAAAAKGVHQDDPSTRVAVKKADVGAAIGELCNGRLSVAISDRRLSSSERKACSGRKAGGAVELEVAQAGASPVYAVTTTKVLTDSFETESFLQYVIDNNQEVTTGNGLDPLTPDELDEAQSTLDNAVGGLG